jgi:ferredoxin
MQYGIEGIFQPFMDYDKSYCNYECVKCSEVCPTGAIIPITSEQKKTIQIGKVIFLLNNCIVNTKEKSCGACAEHCPTKAVRMVSYRGALTIPETNASICIGCGACEYACPAEPYKAIYVEGNPVHQTAFRFKEDKTKENIPQDFPF